MIATNYTKVSYSGSRFGHKFCSKAGSCTQIWSRAKSCSWSRSKIGLWSNSLSISGYDSL